MHLDIKAFACQVQLNKASHFLYNLSNWIWTFVHPPIHQFAPRTSVHPSIHLYTPCICVNPPICLCIPCSSLHPHMSICPLYISMPLYICTSPIHMYTPCISITYLYTTYILVSSPYAQIVCSFLSYY